jgi:hypothetical protein
MLFEEMRTRKRDWVLFTGLLFLTSFGTAAGRPQSRAQREGLSEQDKADLRELIRTGEPGHPVQLDFSKPAHYRFYKKQLALAGITAAKYPQQFHVLEQSRQEHIRSGPAKLQTGTNNTIIPIQIITALGSNNGTSFTSSALSSVPNQPYLSQLTLGLYDQNMNPIGQSQYQQQHGAGEDLEVQATGTATASGSVVVAMSTYFWQDQGGHATHGYIYARASAPPSAINNTAPMPGNGQTLIKLCLGRSGSDCTYTPSGGSGSNVLLPVSGNIVFASNIDRNPSVPNSSLITMARPDATEGGGCTISSTSDFFNPQTTQITGGTITWNLNPAQFQPANGCLTPNSKAIYTFTVGLSLSGIPVYVTITNDPDVPPQNPYYKVIPDLYVYFSCLASGTEVTLADGTFKKIEDVQSGDSVLTNAKGTSMAVDSKLKGTEAIPMIHLKTSKGNDLLLTVGHPVVTSRGIVLARMLVVGDMVMTREGAAPLTSVTHEVFDGNVWNLNVGPRQEDFSHLSKETTFFANGILVGDNQMQFDQNRMMKFQPKAIMQGLPPEWHKDYQNYLATGKSQSHGPNGPNSR